MCIMRVYLCVVRPGVVYRIYSRELHDTMPEHDESEILRSPLDETILNLRSMLETATDFEGVVPILEDTLEPPNMTHITNAFYDLHDKGMIFEPNDTGYLTATGRFAASLPVDLNLGRMIVFGIQLGILEEAVILASALTLPKSPYRVAMPLIHDNPDEYNDIVKTIMTSKFRVDQGSYSDPILLYNLLKEWRSTSGNRREHWLRQNGVVKKRMHDFDSMCTNLLERCLRDRTNTRVYQAATLSDKERMNLMRIILTWNGEKNIMLMKGNKTPVIDCDSIVFDKNISKRQLQEIIPSGYQWKYAVKGSHIYHIPLSTSALLEKTNILDFSISIIAMGALTFVDLVFVIYSSPDSGKKKSKKGNKKVAEELPDEVLVFAIKQQDSSLRNNLTKLFDLKSLQYLDLAVDFGYDAFIVPSPSAKQCKIMKSSDSLAIGAALPSNGTINFYSYDVDVNEQQIFEVFQLEESKHIRVIDGKVSYTLKFENEPNDDEKVENGLFFADAHCGVRLFNAYRYGYKDRYCIPIIYCTYTCMH